VQRLTAKPLVDDVGRGTVRANAMLFDGRARVPFILLCSTSRSVGRLPPRLLSAVTASGLFVAPGARGGSAST
jgi:hypothetical protein